MCFPSVMFERLLGRIAPSRRGGGGYWRPSLGLGLIGASLHLVPASARQWQGHFAIGVREPSSPRPCWRRYFCCGPPPPCCVRSQRRAPGGPFTPSLTIGAMLGGALGYVWSWVWPGVSPGLCALSRSGCHSGGVHPGPHLDRGFDDGVDGTRPVIYLAAVSGGRYRHTGRPNHRTAVDL